MTQPYHHHHLDHTVLHLHIGSSTVSTRLLPCTSQTPNPFPVITEQSKIKFRQINKQTSSSSSTSISSQSVKQSNPLIPTRRHAIRRLLTHQEPSRLRTINAYYTLSFPLPLPEVLDCPSSFNLLTIMSLF